MTSKKELDGTAVNEENVVPAKKRVRIIKKDTDHVFSASQDQVERFDSVSEERTHKRAAAALAKEEKAAAIHALESEVLVPPRKTRGRPSKAYVEAQRAYEEALARRQTDLEEAKAAVTGQPVVSIADSAPAATDTPEDDIPDFIRMQQELMVSGETSEAEESVAVSADSETDAKSAEAENAETSTEKTDEAAPASEKTTEDGDLLARLTAAYKEGQRFIIVEDVPVYDANGYSFMIEDTFDEGHVPFRRFKDEMGEGSSHSVLDTARNLVKGAVSATSKKDAGKENATARHDAAPAAPAVKLGEITIDSEGVLEIDNQGVGYLRSSDYNYMPSPDDIFVPQSAIRNYGLKTGDMVKCKIRVPKEGEKFYALTQIVSINDLAPNEVRDRIAFEHLTPLFPEEQYHLSVRGAKAPLSCRIVDLFAPIGKGQRALIVAQPKTGKTILMKQVANAIAANNPEAYLMMLLIDERPEEVTDMARTVNAEVIASTFDEPAKRHVRIANIVLEKAKRMVECGRDVVIFLDSITRLARAFNTEAPASGRILTGGVDANALQKPKRFFGAARNIEGGGSLTIIATALIDTGSKMDEVIFEEFKGTGNMELVLDRGLANKRIFPAINLVQSSTRREDLLLDELTVNRMFITRGYMADMSPAEAMKFLRSHLEPTISNEEFIATVGS